MRDGDRPAPATAGARRACALDRRLHRDDSRDTQVVIVDVTVIRFPPSLACASRWRRFGLVWQRCCCCAFRCRLLRLHNRQPKLK